YSLATGVRPNPNTNKNWVSSIKPIGDSVTGATVLLDNDQWIETSIEPATDEEIEATIQVMGGSDWESWVDTLINSESIAEGCKTIAFSYIGCEANYPIYRDGTLGWAKVDLHQASHSLNIKLASFNGAAYATACKALVTKASVFIPTFTPYMIALYKAMKEEGNHEGCIEQMQRLFSTKLNQEKPPVDAERLIRMDEWELKPSIQARVSEIMTNMNQNNFKQVGDYHGYKQAFMQLNGFDIHGVDYQQNIDDRYLRSLQP
ncbi:bifunctional NADH-specific enoyl-ACP reductase/trans-2-enoyl-CoA reductase, partial [Vibrio casei]